MLSSLKVGNRRILVSDGFAKGKPNFHGIDLSLSVDSADEANRCFHALTDGGKIIIPMLHPPPLHLLIRITSPALAGSFHIVRSFADNLIERGSGIADFSQDSTESLFGLPRG
jgi:hypothetical protein